VDAEQHIDGAVHLHLSKSEALVLFEWLHRIEANDTELAGLGIADQAEQRVLWDVSALLERLLVEPFDANYAAVITQARADVRDGD